MDVSGEFVLARNVALVDRSRFRPRGDAAGREPPPRSLGAQREGALIRDRATLSLIARFRAPTRISDAIWDVGVELGTDPEEVLDMCYPGLRSLIEAGYIVAAGSAMARAPGAGSRPRLD